jgi:hypothetical protein
MSELLLIGHQWRQRHYWYCFSWVWDTAAAAVKIFLKIIGASGFQWCYTSSVSDKTDAVSAQVRENDGAVRYIKASAVSRTLSMPKQWCVRLRWYSISGVSDSADTASAVSQTRLMQLRNFLKKLAVSQIPLNFDTKKNNADSKPPIVIAYSHF